MTHTTHTIDALNLVKNSQHTFARPLSKIEPAIQDAPQKRYKASFNHVTDEDKKEFKNSHVMLPISVGQKYHEEGEFDATIKLIDKSFKECTILPADTLRRHSPEMFMQCSNLGEVTLLAKHLGDKWIANNTKYISKLSISHKISRWDEWLSHPEYMVYYKSVCGLYDNDSDYKKTVHEDVESFLLRGARKIDITKFNSCVSYILEESAVVCLWVKVGFKFDVYPSGDNNSTRRAYEILMKAHGYKYRSLSLNIKKL